MTDRDDHRRSRDHRRNGNRNSDRERRSRRRPRREESSHRGHRQNESLDNGRQDDSHARGIPLRHSRRKRKAQSPPWAASQHGGDDLQTHYKSLGENAQTHLARVYSKPKQQLHLLGKILLRWFFSFILAVGMIAVFYSYEKVQVLTKPQRRLFSLIGTGFYVTLGLNLAASLKSMAILVRWRLLARKRHPLEEIDFLLGLQSLIKVFNYGCHTITRQKWTALACFAWIFVNAVGRLSIVLTGITYSYDSANATAVEPGLVNTTDWTQMAEVESFVDETDLDDQWTVGAEHYAARSYGLFSSTLLQQPLTDPADFNVNVPLYAPIEVSDDKFVYYFREFKSTSNLAFKTSRHIDASANCTQYPITEGQHGQSTEITYQNRTSETMSLPVALGPASTTWLNPRSDLPKNSAWSCGPRCSPVFALQFRDSDDSRPGALYHCKVYVSNIIDPASDAAHDVPDNIAQIIAGAIGLEGYSNGPNDWEYARYPPGSAWSNYRGGFDDDSNHMASLAARFAIGTIAIKDIYGSKPIQTMGNAAWVGVLLKVKWPWLLAILGSILAVQLVMGISAAVYANQVFCKDDSMLSTARLLRPIVERLGSAGCAITGKEIAGTMGGEMAYGVRVDETGERMHLDIGEDIAPSKGFPEGWYDGEVDV